MTARLETRSGFTARAVWGLLAVCGTITLSGPIIRWTALQTICHPDSACLGFQLDPTAAQTLAAHGIGMTAFAVFNIVVPVACFVGWYGVAALILWRRPADRGALAAAFFLLAIPALGSASNMATNASLSNALGTAAVVGIILFCLLFPDGRFASPWAMALALTFGAVMVVTSLPLPVRPPAMVNVLPVLLFMLIVVAQIHRYRSMSSWVQRQQIKVVLVGLATAIVGIGLLWLPWGIAPFPTGNGSLYNGLTNVMVDVVLTALPVSIGIAMLRNGLWEVDRLINRALVYGSLTVSLAALYIGGVIGLQALFRVVTGQSSDLVVAVVTLIVAALFNPWRHRVQAFIDRRFYRHHYDAARTLAIFQSRLRDDVELSRLVADVLSVTQETVQPAHVALWLREPPAAG